MYQSMYVCRLPWFLILMCAVSGDLHLRVGFLVMHRLRNGRKEKSFDCGACSRQEKKLLPS